LGAKTHVRKEVDEAELVIASFEEEEEALSLPSRIDGLWVPKK
jgi:hypothetical protein